MKNNPKAFYAYARSKTTVKEDVLYVKNSDGKLTCTLQETCDTLNMEFQKVFTSTDNALQLPHVTSQGNKLTEVEVSIDKVKEHMSRLNIQSTAGPDDIHPRVLKECRDALAKPISIICKQSLITGMVPTDWKRAHITPIFKKGSKVDPHNYRPVSLTCVICKLLEKIIRSGITAHLESNNYLSPHQHGFRSNKSCLTQLLEFMHFLEEAVENRECVDIIYLDCSKAFDTVPHELLLYKLKSVGIEGQLWNWIKEFLTDRQQRVKVKGICSEWGGVGSGVPQGSVLGPTLFLIYINDILDGLNSRGKLFADDLKLYRKVMSSDDRQGLQDDLSKLEEWSRKWKLKFNKEKCKVMHIGRKNAGHNYTLNGTTLTTTFLEKDL